MHRHPSTRIIPWNSNCKWHQQTTFLGTHDHTMVSICIIPWKSSCKSRAGQWIAVRCKLASLLPSTGVIPWNSGCTHDPLIDTTHRPGQGARCKSRHSPMRELPGLTAQVTMTWGRPVSFLTIAGKHICLANISAWQTYLLIYISLQTAGAFVWVMSCH